MKQTSQVISILTLKGGVGKSCLSNILANEMAYNQAQLGVENAVCLIDLDMQHTNAEKRKKDLYNLKLDVTSSDYQSLSEDEKLEVRQFQLRYELLYERSKFMAYPLIRVDTTSDNLCDAALDLISSGKYKYVILDFPGTLEQRGTGEFYDKINHLIIPLTTNKSDLLGVQHFIDDVNRIGYPVALKTTHFILNKCEFMKKRLANEIKESFETKYNIKFLDTIVRNTPSFDTNTILPLSIKINLSTGEIIPSQAESLKHFALEVIEIIDKSQSNE